MPPDQLKSRNSNCRSLNEQLELESKSGQMPWKQSELQLQKQKSALIGFSQNKSKGWNQGDLTKALRRNNGNRQPEF
jgi:hypothetical protein